MSKWAEKKKTRILIIVGIVLSIIFVLVGISVSKVEPTCYDGLQNGPESGVDCGGACARVCKDEVRDLVVWWERPFRVAHGVYNVVAFFENQNLESGIKKVNYEFRLYDKNNILVSEPRKGSTFIEANKRSAIFESGLTTGDSEAYTAFFKISSVQDWERTNLSFSYTLYNVGEPVLSEQEVAPKLSATIENKTLFDFTDVPVVAILYDAKDNAIAASRTYIDSFGRDQKEKVYFSWPEPFRSPVARIEILPRIDPFTPIDSLTR